MYPVLSTLKSILIAYLHLIVTTFLYRLSIAKMNPLANLDEATQKRLFEHMAGFFLSQPATSAPPPNPPPAPAPPPSATIVSIPPPYIAPPAAVSSYSSQHASTSSSSQPYLQSPVQGPRDIRAMLDAQHGVPYGRESVPNHSGVGSIHHHAGGRIQVRGHPLQRQQKKPNKIGRPVSIVSTGKVSLTPARLPLTPAPLHNTDDSDSGCLHPVRVFDKEPTCYHRPGQDTMGTFDRIPGDTRLYADVST